MIILYYCISSVGTFNKFGKRKIKDEVVNSPAGEQFKASLVESELIDLHLISSIIYNYHMTEAVQRLYEQLRLEWRESIPENTKQQNLSRKYSARRKRVYSIILLCCNPVFMFIIMFVQCTGI